MISQHWGCIASLLLLRYSSKVPPALRAPGIDARALLPFWGILGYHRDLETAGAFWDFKPDSISVPSNFHASNTQSYNVFRQFLNESPKNNSKKSGEKLEILFF